MLDQRAMLASEPDIAPEPSPPPAPIVPGDPLVTVCGVPLESGERVVFFARPRHARSRALYVLIGVLLAPVLVGFAFIAYGVLYERWHLRFIAVTNRRVILQRGTRPARWILLPDVIDLRARRSARAGAMATPPPPETARDRTDPKHWAGAEAVVVSGRTGTLSIEDDVAPDAVGTALANALWTQGWLDRVPSVHHPS
jgi:hypothetical protein